MVRSDGETVGIDFGTSTCFVGREIGAQRAEVLPIGQGERYLPSLVGHIGGSFVVGEDAESFTPDRVIRSVKSAITADQEMVRVGGRDGATEVSRDDVVTAIFKEIARRARDRGWPLDRGQHLRLGCPAMWLGKQRRLLIELAAAAGLEITVDALIEEPVAAGVAWLNSRRLRHEPASGRVLVFDMGGGTLDLAVLQVGGDEHSSIAVLTSVGMPLAGDRLDEAIVEDLCAERGIDIAAMKEPFQARADLLRQARETKVALSSAQVQTVYFEPFYYGGQIAPFRYDRQRLNAAFKPQMEEAEDLVWRALRLARLTHLDGASAQEILANSHEQLAADVDVVLLVGGMSRVPHVRTRIAELFPKAQLHYVAHTADEAIVTGLADTSGYNTLNMYRPAVDVELVWPVNQRYALYDAYTPLFEVQHLHSGRSFVGYPVEVGQRQGIPHQRNGELRVLNAAGLPVPLIHTKVTALPTPEILSTVPIPFGRKDLRLKFYCNGQLYVTDGQGHDHQIRIAGWPTIGGGDPEVPTPPTDPQPPYPFNKA